MQKLRPLTVTAQASMSHMSKNAPKVSEALESAPELPGFDVEVEEVPVTPADKLELWQRKLLDLTTRNRLLHLPDRAKAIRFVCPDPAGLEDILAANKSVRIVRCPTSKSVVGTEKSMKSAIGKASKKKRHFRPWRATRCSLGWRRASSTLR